MPANDRGGLKAAFTNFKKAGADTEAELRLLGRTVEEEQRPATSVGADLDSYPIATTQPPASGLIPKPLLLREAVRQLSFRCPLSVASELRRKAAFNQLEQQEIIVEGIKRVLLELSDPPSGWES